MNAELETIIQNNGGVFQLEADQPSQVQSIFRTIQSRLERHRQFALKELYSERPRPLHIDLLANTSLNAFAYATPQGENPCFDFVGINVGVPFTLIDIFNRILAHPDTFIDVGNPRLERTEGHDLPFLTTDIIQSGRPLLLPKCPIRAIFASELAQVALDFLFFHELTHLRNGHVDYLRSTVRIVVCQEATGLTSRPLDSSVRQALESDADCGAVLLALNAAYRFRDALRNPSPAASKELLAAVTRAYGTGKLATRTVVFAAYMLFRIFDSTEWVWWKQPSVSHPLPPLRMFLIGPTLYEIFSQRPVYEYDPEEYSQDNASIIFEAENACGQICGREPDPRGIWSVIREHRCLGYIDDFSAQWALLRPELEKYKRGGNLAP